ncbi:CLUMA_CG017066, isoform A [Clunio marinus]|uniref:CLUMA_CG017066, isoform A n=1 Tax=Clunio marinus TaxID=568069 RepID=A0A1J1IZD1_9DIPT|nr:CLUMA_CG017066, isoform A [Clunio marinus]
MLKPFLYKYALICILAEDIVLYIILNTTRHQHKRNEAFLSYSQSLIIIFQASKLNDSFCPLQQERKLFEYPEEILTTYSGKKTFP